jgi:N-acetylmuramoyl-L-alanine amidase
MDKKENPSPENPGDLELKKLQNEIFLQEIEKKIKEKELKRILFFQPTFVTIFVAFIGLMGAAVTSFYQQRSQLQIEEKKFQYSVYQKALEAQDNVTAAKILDFYIKAGLLPGEVGKFGKLLEEGKTDEVPVYGGIYKNVTVPGVDKSQQLTLSDNFIKGKGTEYLLSYNARKRFNQDELTTIVIHSSFSYNIQGTARFLSDTIAGKASAHILIDRDGKVIQQVPFNFLCYHAREFSKSSIGIELINIGEVRKKDAGFVDIYGKSVENSKVECNSSGICWEKYTAAQVETAFKICELLVKQYKITKIVGHAEIDKRKSDPGPFFPISRFKAIIR